MKYQNSIGAKSDKGKQRARNEDAFSTTQVANGDLLVICDGMGGHPGGDLAAKIVATGIRSYYLDHARSIRSMQEKALPNAMQHANELIKEAIDKHPTFNSMGTTCEAVFIQNDIFYWGHIGDSRIYRLSEGKLEQLTKDHSYVQQLLDQGAISPEEALQHPRKNEISKCMGTLFIEPDYSLQAVKLTSGDFLLLCSDGLTNMVSDNTIKEILLQKGSSVQEKVDALIGTANQNGGADNITVILAQHVNQSEAEKKKSPR